MTLEFALALLHGLGWFVTVSAWTALALADPDLRSLIRDNNERLSPPIVAATVGLAGILIWPFFLATFVGWMLWPAMKQALHLHATVSAR